MTEAPTGNVTFLFTDIEGSTMLAQNFPESISAALGKHSSILKDTIESHNGFIFKTIGDAFCSAFKDSANAINAALDIQMNIQNEKWEGAVIKVRIGIHSGQAEWGNSNYTGYLTLAGANRIMSSAFGGQIVISDTTYNLAKEIFYNSKYTLKDLGVRRLKDLIQPVRLYQLTSTGLKEDFPPINTLDARPNNLPVQLTNFIGRENEIREIKNLLSSSRLLTLTGPGGTGKTRLSTKIGSEMIDDFENGVWFLELDSLTDTQFIAKRIITMFRLTVDRDKKDTDVLINYLREKELLLIFDNCEHLIEGCAKISDELLRYCPKLKIIASSREQLHVAGEIVFAVPSLSMPESISDVSASQLSNYESARLFIDRAISVNPNFQITNDNAHVLAQLCYDLDGIPLAIELAASRIKVLTIEKILERLSDRFKLLTGGKRTSLPRQQTLKATMDWSYELLSENEKRLWQRLSLFKGGWTLEAAEAVCSDESLDEYEVLDLLNQLVNKSLVRVYQSESGARYAMLETIRQYGNEKFSSDEEKNDVRRKQFDFFYSMIKDSEEMLSGAGQRIWIKRIKDDYENIRQCLKFAIESFPDDAVHFCLELGKYWEVQSYFSEGFDYLDNAVKNAKNLKSREEGKAEYWKGYFKMQQGNYPAAKEHFTHSLEFFKNLNDKYLEAKVLLGFGTTSMYEVDFENMHLYSGKSLEISRELKNKSLIARNLQVIASGLLQEAKYDEARKMFEECLELFRELEDFVSQAKIIGNIGLLEYCIYNYEKAIQPLEESLKIRIELNDRQGISIALNNLGAAKYMMKNLEEAQVELEESLRICRELGDKRTYVTPLSTLGLICYDRKNFNESMKIFKEVVHISSEIGDKYTLAKGFDGCANNLIEMKEFGKACVALSKFISLMKSSAKKHFIESEYERFELIEKSIKENISISEFEQWKEKGDAMSTEEAIEYVTE